MIEQKQYSQEALNRMLWEAADSSRMNVDGSIYKDYVLLFLFYKYMSDLHMHEMEDLIKQYGDDKERIVLRQKNMRFVLPNNRFRRWFLVGIHAYLLACFYYTQTIA